MAKSKTPGKPTRNLEWEVQSRKHNRKEDPPSERTSAERESASGCLQLSGKHKITVGELEVSAAEARECQDERQEDEEEADVGAKGADEVDEAHEAHSDQEECE